MNKLGQTATNNAEARNDSANTKKTDLPFEKRRVECGCHFGQVVSEDEVRWLKVPIPCSCPVFELLNKPINLLLFKSLTS